jgi:hypothetical protein
MAALNEEWRALTSRWTQRTSEKAKSQGSRLKSVFESGDVPET